MLQKTSENASFLAENAEKICLPILFANAWELTTLRESLHHTLLGASENIDCKLDPVYVSSIMQLLICIDEKEYDLNNQA